METEDFIPGLFQVFLSTSEIWHAFYICILRCESFSVIVYLIFVCRVSLLGGHMITIFQIITRCKSYVSVSHHCGNCFIMVKLLFGSQGCSQEAHDISENMYE